MSSTEAQRRKLQQIQEIAEGWGKLLAREAFPGGPGLDVILFEMSDLRRPVGRTVRVPSDSTHGQRGRCLQYGCDSAGSCW